MMCRLIFDTLIIPYNLAVRKEGGPLCVPEKENPRRLDFPTEGILNPKTFVTINKLLNQPKITQCGN